MKKKPEHLKLIYNNPKGPINYKFQLFIWGFIVGVWSGIALGLTIGLYLK